MQIVRRALEFPTRQLADNAGQEGALIVQEVKKRSGNEGFNVATGKYEDLVKAGCRRSDQSGPHGAAERRFDLRSHDHHRSIGDGVA